MSNHAWFDEGVYLKNKAAQCGLSEADTLAAINNAGMDLFTHYARYGEAEGVAPNELFNPVQYARAVGMSVADTMAAFVAAGVDVVTLAVLAGCWFLASGAQADVRAMRQELADLTQERDTLLSTIKALEAKTWGIRLHEDKAGRFIILPATTKPQPG